MGELDNLRFIVEGLGVVSSFEKHLHNVSYLETPISSFDIFFPAGVGWHFWNNRQHFWNPLVFSETHPEKFPPGS